MSARGRWRHDVRVLTARTQLPAQPPNTVGFLVDLTARDALRLNGPIEAAGLPAAYILFTPRV